MSQPHNNPSKGFHLYPTDEPYLQKLRPEQRVAIEAVENNENSYLAAAEALSIPSGTLKSRVNRARTHIIRMRAAAAEKAGGCDAVGA